MEDLTVKLNKKEDNRVVKIENPRTEDFTVGRTTLIPGMLKWLLNNKNQKLPFKLFEVGDVVLKTENEIGAKNERHVCCLYSNTEQVFETIHGTLDYLMSQLKVESEYELEERNKREKDLP